MHLESALDGTAYDANQVQTTHRGRPLWVRSELDRSEAPGMKAAGVRAESTEETHSFHLRPPTDSAIAR